MDFKSILPKCQTRQSTASKTGVFYCYKEEIILEFVKSTKNVWVEETLIDSITDKVKAEQDIRDFFGNAKMVYVEGLPLRQYDNHAKIKELIFKNMGLS